MNFLKKIIDKLKEQGVISNRDYGVVDENEVSTSPSLGYSIRNQFFKPTGKKIHPELEKLEESTDWVINLPKEEKIEDRTTTTGFMCSASTSLISKSNNENSDISQDISQIARIISTHIELIKNRKLEIVVGGTGIPSKRNAMAEVSSIFRALGVQVIFVTPQELMETEGDYVKLKDKYLKELLERVFECLNSETKLKLMALMPSETYRLLNFPDKPNDETLSILPIKVIITPDFATRIGTIYDLCSEIHALLIGGMGTWQEVIGFILKKISPQQISENRESIPNNNHATTLFAPAVKEILTVIKNQYESEMAQRNNNSNQTDEDSPSTEESQGNFKRIRNGIISTLANLFARNSKLLDFKQPTTVKDIIELINFILDNIG